MVATHREMREMVRRYRVQCTEVRWMLSVGTPAGIVKAHRKIAEKYRLTLLGYGYTAQQIAKWAARDLTREAI